MVYTTTTLIALFLAAVFRWYPKPEFFSDRPNVSVGKGGTIVGRRIQFTIGGEQYDQETYLGIPFATPPLNGLRFHPPVPLPDDEARVVDAYEHGFACMQPIHLSPPWIPLTREEISEDCLTLNIVRPVLNSTPSLLPVMVWIYGGGWDTGTSQWYDGRGIVAQSVIIDRPVIYVSLNYRLNAFGFLASQDFEDRARSRKDVAMNLGYLDQRLALEWVQKNIAYFGGDPTKVTVFGESAGAFAIGAHLSAENHVPRKLFRAAIMQSGATAGVPVVPPGRYQNAYERFLEEVNCGSRSLAPSNNDSIDCMRTVSPDALLDAVMKTRDDGYLVSTAAEIPWFPVQDDDFHRLSPTKALKTGKVAKVPTIIGTTLDEGTLFAERGVDSDNMLKSTIHRTWGFFESNTSSESMDKLLSLYPDVPREGSPFINPSLSNDSLQFDPDSRIFKPLSTNQFKRLAAIFGDMAFESGRRLQLEAHNRGQLASRFGVLGQKVPIWSYHFRQPAANGKSHMGVYHATDIHFVFAWSAWEDSDEGEVARAVSRAWVRFTNDLNPNGPEIPSWPVYDSLSKQMLQVRARNMTIISDDFRVEAIKWITYNEDWTYITGR